MKAFQYHTTSKTNALAMVAKLRAAGYSHLQGNDKKFAKLPPLTFTTRTYRSCGPKPVHAMTWAYSKRAPLPPRRKYGRDLCSQCGERRVHTRKLCANCRERERYATDPDFRRRQNEKSRKKMAELYRIDEWRAKRKAYQLKWAKAKRARAREGRAAA